MPERNSQPSSCQTQYHTSSHRSPRARMAAGPASLFALLLALLLALSSAPTEVAAQAPTGTSPRDSTSIVAKRPARTRTWLGLGPAFATNARGVGGIGGAIEWALQRDAWVLMVRGAGGTEVNLVSDGSNEGVGDYGVLIGRATVRRESHVVAAVGVGRMIGGCGPGVACPDLVSIPLVIEASSHLGAVVGLSGQVFANLNRRSPMIGTALMLQVGWLGGKK